MSGFVQFATTVARHRCMVAGARWLKGHRPCVAAAVVAIVVGCSADLAVPDTTRVTCRTSVDCPGDRVCLEDVEACASADAPCIEERQGAFLSARDGTACLLASGSNGSCVGGQCYQFQVAVAAGGQFTCGIRTNGSVTCWGSDEYNQSTPTPGQFRELSAGQSHVCGLHPDGELACWGFHSDGRCSPPAGTFVRVSSGKMHSCALDIRGRITCWGFGKTGEDCGFWSTPPGFDCGQAVPPDGEFTEISAGGLHTCALDDRGDVTCWGSDEFGQLAVPNGTYQHISAGGLHTCGLRSDGSVECWGDNSVWQLAAPSTRLTVLSAGTFHTCGLSVTGKIECWGANGDGQRTSPDGYFRHVSAGMYHSCGLLASHGVVCWGADHDGQCSVAAGFP